MQPDAELIIEILEDPDCGYRARALGVGIFTFANSLELLRENIREAVEAFYDGEEQRPGVVKLHFIREEVLSW